MSLTVEQKVNRRMLGSKLGLSEASYLSQIGWFESAESSTPTDAHGHPIPWFTYPAIHFLKERILKDELHVFEFGSGNSTLWWMNIAASVHSVEHEEEWFERIRAQISQKVTYEHVLLEYDGRYCRAIADKQMAFDVVVVDGRDRVNCIKHSIPALTDRGVLILDNADRDSYRPGFDLLTQEGYSNLTFTGMGPVNLAAWSTTIFYRSGNCLGI